MRRSQWYAILGLVTLLAVVSAAQAQSYIGFVYPGGGQQGTTFQITFGGQSLEGVNSVFISGSGVQAKVVEYNKKIGSSELMLLNEQLKELKNPLEQKPDEGMTNLIARLEKLTSEYVDRPASASIANLVIVEVTIDPDAQPGEREIRLGTPRGVSNPLVFNVGQLPEVSASPAPTSPLQVLGKEAQSLRRKKRAIGGRGGSEMMMTTTMMDGPGSQSDFDDDEVRIKMPCTVNGQISSGAVDRFRFEACKGQRLVVIVQARGLIPYMADAVPGWFQPVLVLCNANGKEVAYNDDYRCSPDPVILYEVPEDGEYTFAIYDALYRGRENFVYRITIGELPFVTSIFPLGGRVGTSTTVEMKGWNLAEAMTTPDTEDAVPGVYPITTRGTNGLVSNPMLFAMDTLPECLEKEPNNTPATAQKVTLPIIVNGRIDPPGNGDVFQFEGHVGVEVVAEVYARRLDSPLDSMLKLTDASGKCLVFNDDNEDVGSGLNTHHADSYIRATLPTNGIYYIHLNDTQHHGGIEYAYRLRISAPQPDFALRIVPSSINIRSNSAASLKVYAIRQDGFTGNIKFNLKGAPSGFELKGGNLTGTQELARLTLKTSLGETQDPVNLIIEGCATNGGRKVVHAAVPAEDRMQAFLWRHLVPAKELKAFVFTPTPPQKPKPPKQPAAPVTSKP
ncbi:MAG: hypothetical protein KJ964_09265 [Verrucomicrobia bacterium]|nr:hypothetical protein [Verrucomicrobiota bacterium]MBU1855717.1 hypothetical protein [Verrucomicrobiota bacterium]